jgi:hypothetical protein
MTGSTCALIWRAISVPERTFGETLRACRLGWFPAVRREAWVQAIAAPSGGFLVRFCPYGQLVAVTRRDRSHGEYKHLGSADLSVDELLDLDPQLRMVKRIKQPFAMHVPDDN